MRESVEVSHEDKLTSLQMQGVLLNTITLIGELRKYHLLSLNIRDSYKKRTNSIVLDIYRMREMELITDIRTRIDSIYAYVLDGTVIINYEKIKRKFENNLKFLTSNLTGGSVLTDDESFRIFDNFADMLEIMIGKISESPILDESFTI